jgi:cellulose synthase/poly-beta-1,6-N-acetylglucosamine synthase-like glycosyltransferase
LSILFFILQVNTLRNVALNNARTDFVILADVDFVPSSGIYEAAKAFVENLIAQGLQDQKKVLVFPCVCVCV